MLFYNEVLNFKLEYDDSKLKKLHSKKIILKYIKPGVKYSVPIKPEIGEVLLQKHYICSKDMFDKALNEVKEIIKEKFYLKYVESEYYKDAYRMSQWIEKFDSLPSASMFGIQSTFNQKLILSRQLTDFVETKIKAHLSSQRSKICTLIKRKFSGKNVITI